MFTFIRDTPSDFLLEMGLKWYILSLFQDKQSTLKSIVSTFIQSCLVIKALNSSPDQNVHFFSSNGIIFQLRGVETRSILASNQTLGAL